MKLSPAVPELLVPNVEEAQEYFRDRMGFKVGWIQDEGRIGAVSHGECVFFFREGSDVFDPGTFWIFVEDVDRTYRELCNRGADIVDPPEDKPWGLRQFTIRDHLNNRFHFHHDL